MENNNEYVQIDDDDVMSLLEMQDRVGKARAMVSFIAETLLMASNSPSEIDEEWFGELSLYANSVADVLEPIVDGLKTLESIVDALPNSIDVKFLL